MIQTLCFFLIRYLQEVGYSDTILDVRSQRVRALLGKSYDATSPSFSAEKDGRILNGMSENEENMQAVEYVTINKLIRFSYWKSGYWNNSSIKLNLLFTYLPTIENQNCTKGIQESVESRFEGTKKGIHYVLHRRIHCKLHCYMYNYEFLRCYGLVLWPFFNALIGKWPILIYWLLSEGLCINDCLLGINY